MSGVGVMSGITGRYRRYNPNPDKEPIKQKIIDQTGLVYEHKHERKGTRPGVTIDFEKQGNEAFNILEKDGFETAIQWVKNEYKELRLYPQDFVKLLSMIKTIGKF